MMYFFEYSNNNGDEHMNKTFIITCHFCGEKSRTDNDVVAQHLIQNGCEKCQQRYNRLSEKILQQIPNWDEIWTKDTNTPLQKEK